MEIVGVPFADYDWVTHGVCGFAPQTSHQITVSTTRLPAFTKSRHEPNLNNLSFRSRDAVAASGWRRQSTRILNIPCRIGYGHVRQYETGRSWSNSRAP